MTAPGSCRNREAAMLQHAFSGLMKALERLQEALDRGRG
jgi:hypothetical protein